MTTGQRGHFGCKTEYYGDPIGKMHIGANDLWECQIPNPPEGGSVNVETFQALPISP